MLKRCTRCGITKPASEYYCASVLRLHSHCKDCMKRHSRDPPERETRTPWVQPPLRPARTRYIRPRER